MSSGVKKVFMVLITIVALVLLGAFALNVLMPNTTATMVNATEDMIFRATGLSFDLNNDGESGDADSTDYQGEEGDGDGVGTDNVDGFN